jgi:hypothetical protein
MPGKNGDAIVRRAITDALPDGDGLVELARARYHAWLSERRVGVHMRVLDSRRRLLDGQAAVAETELCARRRLSELAIQAEEAQSELLWRRQLREVTYSEARRILGAEVETQKLLLQREALRRHRAMGTLPTPSAQGHRSGGLIALPAAEITDEEDDGIGKPEPAPQDPFEVDVTDQQVEALALKAVARFSQLSTEEAETAWEAWRRELRRRYAPYTAAEVAQRAEELRGLIR